MPPGKHGVASRERPRLRSCAPGRPAVHNWPHHGRLAVHDCSGSQLDVEARPVGCWLLWVAAQARTHLGS